MYGVSGNMYVCFALFSTPHVFRWACKKGGYFETKLSLGYGIMDMVNKVNG